LTVTRVTPNSCPSSCWVSCVCKRVAIFIVFLKVAGYGSGAALVVSQG
jgi:hypothetical protein